MNEVQHASRAHARLNASSTHRWMMCPPSVKLSENFADTPSTFAEEGTYLHELCELKLHKYLGDMMAMPFSPVLPIMVQPRSRYVPLFRVTTPVILPV